MSTYNDSDNDNKVYDARTDTFISIKNNKLTDKPTDKSVDDTNERVIWTFTLGIPIDTTHAYDPEQKTDNFENAVFEMTKEMTKITDGLTYEYCYGMWLQKNHGTHELTYLRKDNSNSSNSNNNSNSNSNSNSNNIEHNLSVQITIIVLPQIADEVYNLVKHIISKVNKKYELGLIHVQAMKTRGTSHHFVLN
jgi:hypothetical protein